MAFIRNPNLRLLFVCLPVLLSHAAASQVSKNKNSLAQSILALYYQVKNQLPPPIPQPCKVYGAEATPYAAMEKALQLNQLGQWQCSQKIIEQQLTGEKQLNPGNRLLLLITRAEYLNSHHLYDSARYIGELANAEADIQNASALKPRILILLSNVALQKRNMNEAFAYADSALQLSRITGNKLFEGTSLMQTGMCARRNFTSLAGRAFPYYLQAKEIAEQVNDSLILFRSNLLLASDNFQIDRWEEGMPYFKKAIAIALKTENAFHSYSIHVLLGIALLYHNYVNEALVIFKKAMLLSQTQNVPYSLQHTYVQLADVFTQQQQFDSALHYAELAENVKGVDSFWANMWNIKAGIYHAKGDYKLATEMYIQAMNWANKDFLYRNQQQLSSYETKLKTHEQELLVGLEKKRRTQTEWGIAVVILLLLLVFAGLIRQTRARRKLALQNTIIEKQQQDLQKSLAEKDMLLKEIHHRVKNNLTVIGGLLELQSNGINNEEAKAAIAEGQGRVRSIALIHQRLYQHENLAAIEFSGFVKEMLQQVTSIFKQPGQILTTDIQVQETLLDVDTAVPLGLILNELLTNSYKYAFVPDKNGYISISLHTKAAGHFELIYRDNGPGLPEGFNLKKATSMGLRLIHRLSIQLGGGATWHMDEGCVFTISFTDTETRNAAA